MDDQQRKDDDQRVEPEPAQVWSGEPALPPSPHSERSEEPGDAPRRGLPAWAQYAIAAVAVVAVLAFIFVPRFSEDDPLESLGEEGSPARLVATALEGEMTCNAGEIGQERSILACYAQDAERVAMVFLQSDREGNVASYTAETLPLGSTPDTGQAIGTANRIAAVVTPGSDFTECSHSYDTEFFCFGSLASWESTSVLPVQETGEKERMPSSDAIGESLNGQGWDCDYGICLHGETSMTVVQPLTGLALRFSAPVDMNDVQQAVTALLELTPDTDALREWVPSIDGTLNIVVADGFVVGYVPQVGDGGLVVLDEVAGVLPDRA